MLALTRFATAEFGKAFVYRKTAGRRVGTPTARDFLWLTIFFALCSFMLFLGISAHNGVWDRFEQVLLGALPGTGPPVRVSHHFVERPEKISGQLVGQFAEQFPEYSIVPIRQLDGRSGTVVLPGLAVNGQASDALNLPIERQREDERKIDATLSWGLSKVGSNTPLRIFAMPTDAPVWRWAAKDKVDAAPFPMTIVASRTLFKRHFRYANYRAAIVGNQYVPCAIRSALPKELKDPSELGSLVLEVKEGNLRTAYHQFDVVWVDSFPLPDQVAFIMPLSTVELLVATDGRPSLDLNLESRGEPSSRIRQVWFRDFEGNAAVSTQFRRFAQCLGAAPSAATARRSDLACDAEWDRSTDCEMSETCVVPRRRGDDNDLMVTASKAWPLRKQHVASCANQAGLSGIFSSGHPLKDQIVVDYNDETPRYRWEGPGRISVPCSTLVESDFADGQRNQNCAAANHVGENSIGVAWLPGYAEAMVYAKARGFSDGAAATRSTPAVQAPSNLHTTVEALLGWRPGEIPVFSLDPGYESALVRFGVLSTLIDYISTPLAGSLFLLYMVLSYVFLATTFLHRRAQYGLLEMNGVLPLQIHYIVWVQIMLSCLIGCVVGYALFMGSAFLVELALKKSEIVGEAREFIGLDVPRFLGEVSITTLFQLWLLVSNISCALATALLLSQGVSQEKAPIELIKS